jgi:multicomponent Na+:H+ antiporter subunit D
VESAATDAGYDWLIIVFAAVSAVTGGAVLRVAGRVFLGWGPSEGPDPSQARAAEERVDETRGTRDRTPPLMIVVPAVFLFGATFAGLVPGFVPWVVGQSERFTDHAAYAAWVLRSAAVHWPATAITHVSAFDVAAGLATMLMAFGLAALGLFGRPLREGLPATIADPSRGFVKRMRALHSGHIGDYIAWWSAGASLLGGVCLVALR